MSRPECCDNSPANGQSPFARATPVLECWIPICLPSAFTCRWKIPLKCFGGIQNTLKLTLHMTIPHIFKEVFELFFHDKNFGPLTWQNFSFIVIQVSLIFYLLLYLKLVTIIFNREFTVPGIVMNCLQMLSLLNLWSRYYYHRWANPGLVRISNLLKQ